MIRRSRIDFIKRRFRGGIQVSLLSAVAVAFSLGTLFAVAVAPSVAHATSVTETQAIPSTGTDWSFPLNFLGFNSFSTGGTLQSVDFIMTETVKGTAQGTNSGESVASGFFQIQNTATLFLASNPLVVNTQNSVAISLNPNEFSGVLTIAGSNSSTTHLTTGLASFLSAYSATATDEGSESLHFTGGFLQAGFTDFGALSVQAIYNYQPDNQVPEPITMLLFGAGLLGIGSTKLRKKA